MDMADNKPKTFARNNSTGRRNSGSGRPSSHAKNTNVNQGSSRDLLSREEEYKRLNDELEAKTATLVREAETVISEQSDIFSGHSLLDQADHDDLYGNDDDDSYEISDSITTVTPSASRQSTSRASAKISNETRAQTHGRQQTRVRPSSGGRKPPSARTKSKSGARSNAADNVAVPDETFLTEFKDFSLQNAITNIEDRLDTDDVMVQDDDDVLPSAAAEMGAEAQIRFLKAKLRVMQEELDRLAAECTRKDETSSELSVRLKEVEEERSRYQRTSSSQQMQIDKYKRLAEETKGKADSLDNQLSAVKKELDSMKRVNKQQTSNQGTTEVRLNRALEEVEKYKAELSKSKSHAKETKDTEKKKMEQLLAENKRLEKQKNELMTGFKKQLKLIDILKRQKMHIEAAKMLSFTEEEFVKALEWGQ